MSGVLELCGDLMAAPTRATRSVLDERRDSALLLLFFGGVVAQSLAGAIAEGSSGIGVSALVAAALLGAVISLLGGAALLHLSAGLLGGDGTPADLLRICALVYFPNLLLPPFALWGGAPFVFARGVVLAWQVVLLVIGLREVYRVSSGVATVAIALPVTFMLFVLPVATIFVVLLGLVSMI